MSSDRTSWMDRLAVWLLLVGGVVLPVLGWVLGLVLLWGRGPWTLEERLIGTFLVPGGLAAGLGLLLYGTHSTGVCGGILQPGPSPRAR